MVVAAPAETPNAPPTHPLILFCAFTIVLVGTTVLLGWAFHYAPLTEVLPGHVSMKANSALCFVAAGIALLAGTRRSSRTARLISLFSASAVLVCAGASLAEHLVPIDLHIDQILIHDPVRSAFPGRMSQITATNFCLAAIAALLAYGSPLARRFSQWIALTAFAASFASVIGFAYGVTVLYGAIGHNAMALHTGACFLLLTSGLLLVPADSVLATLLDGPERGAWLGRRFLPAVLLLPPVLGWIYLRPSVSFGSTPFSMALFAVTLAAAGTGGLYLLANIVNHEDRLAAELNRIREQSAAAIRQSEQELRLITDQLPTLIAYIDPEGRFVRVNRTYELWTGLSATEIVGKTIPELLGEPYWQSTETARASAAQGHIVTFDALYPTLQGDRRVQVTYAPDRDSEGRLQGIASLVLDVHDRHQAEAALLQSEKLAAVGRLASSIAHEINNPLEAVTNLLYLAGQDTGSVYIEQAQQELARVTQIVIQTLRFHRQSTGPVACFLSDLIDQILVLYQGKLNQAGIIVEKRSRIAQPLLCRDGEIRQVLANLIGNAADAMSPAPPSASPRLFLRTAPATHPKTGVHGIRITVADTGHGIPAATRRTLFEPFHTTKGETGSGLGLWISRDIVHRHNGSIKLRSSTSAAHSGTVFQVFLFDLPPATETLTTSQTRTAP